uniref:Uncharacterized protein n=1 Tax=Rhizophora mucronata TaxID=61149 RepID=A0A2P2QBY0_RHIMU
MTFPNEAAIFVKLFAQLLTVGGM